MKSKPTLVAENSKSEPGVLPLSHDGAEEKEGEKEEEDDKDEEEEEQWGWIAMLATFFIQVTVPSLKVAFGVLYAELLAGKWMSNTEASLVVAVFVGVSSVLGSMSTSLSFLLSYRAVVLLGILSISLGLALCTLFLTLPWFLVCYSVFGGVGFSMVNTTTFLITQKYFTKRRGAANFFTSFGASLSILIMPLSIYILVLSFSLRGSLLIWSGIILNALVGAMFYAPALWQSKPRQKVACTKLLPISNGNLSDNELNDIKTCNDLNDRSYVYREVNRPHDKIFNCIKPKGDAEFSHLNHKRQIRSEPDIFRDSDSDNLSMKSLPQISSANEEGENDVYFDAKAAEERSVSFMSAAASMDSFNTINTRYISVENMFSSLYSLDIMSNNTLPTVNEMKNGLRVKKRIKVKRVKKNLTDLKPFTNAVFLTYCLSSVINKQVRLSYIVYLPLFSMATGYRNEIPFLLAIIATSEFIAKFVVALVARRKWVPTRCVYVILSFANSICCIVLLLSDGYLSGGFLPLALATAGLGFGVRICVSADSVLLVKHSSSEFLTHSYGLVLFLTGLFGLLVFPIQGWTLDVSGNFETLWIIMASLAAVPGALWTLTSTLFMKK